MALLHRSHHRRRERSDGDDHAKTHNDHCWKKGVPVTAWTIFDTRQSKESKADGSNDGSDYQRELRAIAVHQAASPARKQKHDENERDECSASSRRRIALYLNEIER